MTEKARIAQNDRWNTNFGRALIEMDQISGRFAARQKATVIGENAPTYPKAAQWSIDRTGDEPSFGVDVSAPVVVGEAFEVQRSIDRINSASMSPVHAGQGEPPLSPRNVVGSPTPTPKLLRRPLR